MTGWRLGWLVIPEPFVRGRGKAGPEPLHFGFHTGPARRPGRLPAGDHRPAGTAPRRIQGPPGLSGTGPGSHRLSHHRTSPKAPSISTPTAAPLTDDSFRLCPSPIGRGRRRHHSRHRLRQPRRQQPRPLRLHQRTSTPGRRRGTDSPATRLTPAQHRAPLAASSTMHPNPPADLPGGFPKRKRTTTPLGRGLLSVVPIPPLISGGSRSEKARRQPGSGRTSGPEWRRWRGVGAGAGASGPERQRLRASSLPPWREPQRVWPEQPSLQRGLAAALAGAAFFAAGLAAALGGSSLLHSGLGSSLGGEQPSSQRGLGGSLSGRQPSSRRAWQQPWPEQPSSRRAWQRP